MRKLSPKSARKYSDLLKLARTICDTKSSWLHLCHDGTVVIFNQKSGELATGGVKLDRGEFERFVRFYERGQRVRK
jgi:hypothetical protein